MIDINLIRESTEAVKKSVKKRGGKADPALVDLVKKKDETWRKLKKEVEDIRKQRNDIAKEIAQRKKDKKDAVDLVKKSKKLQVSMGDKEKKMVALQGEITHAMMRIPNMCHDSVPAGDSEEQNVVVSTTGKKPTYSFDLKSHVDLLAEHDWADLDRAGKIAGSRFYYLKGELLQFDRALLQYGLDFMADKGFTLVQPPFMMNREAYEGVINFETFDDTMYKVDGEDLYLIATSEHPLTAMYMNEILESGRLPIKMCGISPCFRKELGSHGRDTKGIFRVHHFNKIEQIVFCKPEDSWKIHEDIKKHAEEFFKSLGFHFRTVILCGGDASSVAAKCYDIEVWYPVQHTFREVVSASNCLDYQTRRLRTRIRGKGKNIIPHSLNSTCVASPRALAACLENFQQKDGSVTVPKVLQPYMNGKKVIGKPSKK